MWCSELALSSIIYSERSRRGCIHPSDKCAPRSPEHRFGRNLLPAPRIYAEALGEAARYG